MKTIVFSPPNKASGRPTLFLHGFPAIRSQQNRFYAERVAAQLSRDCTVLLYDGLGFSPGIFSFAHTLKEVDAFFSSFASEETVDVVGHSWGGFLSIYLASLYGDRIGRLVLMSPLIRFEEAKLSREAFIQVAAENKQISLGDLAVLEKDFNDIAGKYKTAELVAKIPGNVTISVLQAADDQITPPQFSKEILGQFKKPPHYEILNTDHSFLENRDVNLAKIVGALKI